MNAYNHHRIIEEVNIRLFEETQKDQSLIPVFNVFSKNISLLESASDYTDDFVNDWKWEGLSENIKDTFSRLSKLQGLDPDAFFYYHFYYDIELGGKKQKDKGSIKLTRCKKNDNRYKSTFVNCDLGDNRFPIKKYKSFFSAINNRADWIKDDYKDLSNQSDCVAFLHAMGAEKKIDGRVVGETEKGAQRVFAEHLKKCFAEYLYLSDNAEAMFMLGIALHGIMDSFTPSHMGFQHYAAQDMALHAQGDVVVFANDKPQYDPGQYSLDAVASHGKTSIVDYFVKHFDSSNELKGKEFLNQFGSNQTKNMFRIFVELGDFEKDKDILMLVEGKKETAQVYTHGSGYHDITINARQSKESVNNILAIKKYGEKAYIYSNAAIDVCKEVFVILTTTRLEINSFDKYNSMKKSVDDAYSVWEKRYNELEDDRNKHLGLRLYDK